MYLVTPLVKEVVPLFTLLCSATTVTFADDTDILLMMDSSASVGQKNFDTSKAFVRRLAERFLTAERRGRAGVRVGVAQYSRTSRMEQEFTSNLTQLALRVDEAAFQNDGTDVVGAMNFAAQRFQGRGDSGGGVSQPISDTGDPFFT